MTCERTKTKPLLLDSLSIIAPFVLYCQSVPALKKVTNIKVNFQLSPLSTKKRKKIELKQTFEDFWHILDQSSPPPGTQIYKYIRHPSLSTNSN